MTDHSEPKTCSTCGASPIPGDLGLCDACWEVESRLPAYLQRGGADAGMVLRTHLKPHVHVFVDAEPDDNREWNVVVCAEGGDQADGDIVAWSTEPLAARRMAKNLVHMFVALGFTVTGELAEEVAGG